MIHKPFQPGYASTIGSFDQNKNRIVELDWSADGRQFSFRVDPPGGHDTSHAGVYFWQPIDDPVHGASYQVIRDCVREGYTPCQVVNPSNAYFWKTIGVQWSPIRGDNTILLTVQLTAEGRNALALTEAVQDPYYANNAPTFVRYDYGTWNAGGQSITVSGRRPDGHVIIGEVNRNLTGERVILDGSSRGLWLRDAVRLPNGRYMALGRPGHPGSGAVALYDQTGAQRSDFIGPAAPEDVRWFPDRSAVVVSVQGQQYTVQVNNGAISNETQLVGNPQFGAGAGGQSVASIPDAVIERTEYAPGEQLRIVLPYLNLRGQPTTSSAVVGGLVAGDYVAVFAGPYDNEGYRWWRVQTADNNFGWIAGTINGAPTVRRL